MGAEVENAEIEVVVGAVWPPSLIAFRVVLELMAPIIYFE
jgi:hypothetical protein